MIQMSILKFDFDSITNKKIQAISLSKAGLRKNKKAA